MINYREASINKMCLLKVHCKTKTSTNQNSGKRDLQQRYKSQQRTINLLVVEML